MPLQLRHHDLNRRHLQNGELALTYTGRGVREWLGRIEGYPTGVLAVVTRDDVALPPQLEVCAADAKTELEDHPMVPRLRAAVADALFAAHRTNAAALLEELSGLEVRWAPGAERVAKERERRAFEAVSQVIFQIADDLATRARRRRSSEIMNRSVTYGISTAEAAEAASFMQHLEEPASPPPRPKPPERAPVFTEDALAQIDAHMQEARNTEMPQRLPAGTRRALLRLPPGVYVCEDGLLIPYPEMKAALDQAARLDGSSTSRSVIDWDGEWPVLVRGWGAGGLPGYRLDEALVRWHRRRVGDAASP